MFKARALRGTTGLAFASAVMLSSAVTHAETNRTFSLDISPDQNPFIYGGEAVSECQWPTTVSLGGCTGTLVHPSVVIYAAHCGDGINSAAFGETSSGAKRRVQTKACKAHPGWGNGDNSYGDGTDWAFCVLSEPQYDIPIVPILMGCEDTILQPGKEVVLVGFGETEDGSSGTKRAVTTTIGSVGQELFAGGGGKDTCQGDSGGPVYIKLDSEQGGDDTWRVFGITSYGSGCGNGGSYSMMHLGMEWFEEGLAEYGIDITPCGDSEGNWDPTPQCGAFPKSPDNPDGATWAEGCGPEEDVGEASSVCGDPYTSIPDDEPPSVEITAPADQSTFETGEDDKVGVMIEVDADDGDGWGIQDVVLLINGNESGNDPYAPYDWLGNFPSGGYILEVVAYDYAGNMTKSAPVHIGVDEAPPEPEPEPEDEGTTGDDGSSDGTGTGTGDGDEDDDDAGQDEDGDDKGCGCRSDATPTPWSLLAFAGLLVTLRRRRR